MERGGVGNTLSDSAPHIIGHITLDMKQTGKRRTGNPFAPFEGEGAGDGSTANLIGHEAGNGGYRQGKPRGRPRQSSTLPIRNKGLPGGNDRIEFAQ